MQFLATTIQSLRRQYFHKSRKETFKTIIIALKSEIKKLILAMVHDVPDICSK